MARRRAIAPLKQAVNQFLGGKQIAAVRSLGEARLALAHSDDYPSDVLWAESLYLEFSRRLLDADDTTLTVAIRELYETGSSVPAGARVVASIERVGEPRPVKVEFPIEQLPSDISMPLAGLGEGDFALSVVIDDKNGRLASAAYRFSLVKNLSARLAAAAAALDFSKDARSIDRESIIALVKLLTGLAGGDVLETEYPAARLMSEIEQAIATTKTGETFYNSARAGEFWLRVPIGDQSWPVRIFVPPAAEADGASPLVVALHGAGGSENLFFDGYGEGAIKNECQHRGWIVVSPRTEGFGLLPVEQLVEALGKNYAIDREHVYLIGHSMGALQATAAAQARPDFYTAVAALGGGGVVKPSDAIKLLPYYVAAGREDFALAGVERLVSNLRKAGVEKVVFREYPDVEHLLIVQESLPEVFQFFDEAANAK
ncbi:MAG TPA: alpha/beta fold hydrolase [Pirellulales bacterium]